MAKRENPTTGTSGGGFSADAHPGAAVGDNRMIKKHGNVRALIAAGVVVGFPCVACGKLCGASCPKEAPAELFHDLPTCPAFDALDSLGAGARYIEACRKWASAGLEPENE